MISSELISKPPHALRALRGTSLSRSIVLAIGISLVVIQLFALAVTLYRDHGEIVQAANKRADAALDMLSSVHTQAMRNRGSVGDNDRAIATLNGTMQQFSNASRDVGLWVVMGPKIIAFQKAQGHAEIEPARDQVDRAAIASGQKQINEGNNILRQSRPIIFGRGVATAENCGRCHEAMMNIRPGEVMGVYSAAVNMWEEEAQFWATARMRIVFALGLAGVTMLLTYFLLRKSTFRPIERLTQSTHKLALGELDFTVTDTERSDEIGDLARSLAVFRSNLLEKRELAEQNDYMARHDALTGLPNRVSFGRILEGEIKAAQESNGKLAVIGIDLDRFKEINDRHGHSMGDEVLIAVAMRAQNILKEGETLARIGGDEFSAAKPYESLEDLDDFLVRLRLAVTQPVHSGGYSFTVGASFGVSLFPDDGHERETLVGNADLAMYRAKSDPFVSTCYYEASMDERARARSAMVADLRKAVAEDQLSLHYQPQNDANTGQLIAFEALLRWKHPEHGFIPPQEFVSIAEECGLIIEIGDWVLRKACATAAQWADDIRIAINISAVQLAMPGLPNRIHEILVETGLPPRRLELEITETAIISDKVAALHQLRYLKALGISISIDDFGCGYSSLDMLNSFPFDKIKIDKSFLGNSNEGPKSLAVIRAILAIGKSLNVPVLAEGVETSEQLALLQAEGCAEVQGFLFGRPMPDDQIDWDGTNKLPAKVAYRRASGKQ
jgi:diguanylate cyclase (GGDEF)-like protein